jgi:hypothetical protein
VELEPNSKEGATSMVPSPLYSSVITCLVVFQSKPLLLDSDTRLWKSKYIRY